jgi:hypothetical protein
LIRSWRTAVLFSFGAAAVANAGVILTFDLTSAGNVGMDQNYGDRVTATSDTAGSYGAFGTGFTPNVVVSYAGSPGSSPSNLTRWTTDYGDLVNVLENELDGDDRLTVTLVADPGFNVRLYSFSLGGWPDADYTIPNLFIKDGGGNNLSIQSNVLVRGATGTPRHTDINFAPLISASTVQIYIDLSGFGGLSDNIGIDNIAFDQVPAANGVPEPGTWALFAGGFGTLLVFGRRK